MYKILQSTIKIFITLPGFLSLADTRKNGKWSKSTTFILSKHSLENPKGGFGTLPDLILADGGITQIKAILSLIMHCFLLL